MPTLAGFLLLAAQDSDPWETIYRHERRLRAFESEQASRVSDEALAQLRLELSGFLQESRALSEAHPEVGAIHRQQGEALRMLHRYDEAVECYTRALEANEPDPDAAVGRALANLERVQDRLLGASAGQRLRNAEDASELLALIQADLAAGPEDPPDVVELWDAYLRGDYGLVEQATTGRIQGGAAAADHYFLRSLVRRDREAIADLTAALDLDRAAPRVWLHRGVWYAMLGEPGLAIEDFTEAIRLRPGYGPAFTARGVARVQTGDPRAAVADFDEAIRLEPDNAQAWMARGSARRDLGEPEGALADYCESLRIEPDNAWALALRGQVRTSMGDLDGAIADLTEAVRLEPRLDSACIARALAREGQGDLEGARQDLDSAARLAPDNATIYFHRGPLRRAAGDIAGAIADLERFLRMEPAGERADSARTMLREWRDE